nr:LysR substrate-binding domain-containing protein [Pseudonocardia acidicola]
MVGLADTGSVRAAAQRLVVTESSVSSAISALAAEVGVPLVDRDGRGVRLTPAGARYAEYARRILGLHAEAIAAARGEADPEHGTVRLAAVTTAGEHVLPALLASFRAEHPDVALGLEVAPRDAVWPMLARHEVDLVVAGRPPDRFDAVVRAVSPNTLVVVGPPAAATGFDPGAATWLLREPESGVRATMEALWSSLDLDPPRMTLGSHGAVVAAAMAGLGVTLVSRQAVEAALAAGTLVELPTPGTPLQRPWHAVTHSPATASTELLIAHLLAHPELGWRRPPSATRR